jgi:hypothetical protein
LQPYLASGHYSLADLPDSAQLYLKTDFNPLYSEKDRATNGDSQRVQFTTRSVSGGIFSKSGPVAGYLTIDNSVLDATARYRDVAYTLESRRQEWNVAAGGILRRGPVRIGAALGRHLPQGMEREHVAAIRSKPAKYLRQGPWQGSLELEADFNNVAGHFSLYSGPIHSSVTTLATSDGAAFRSFPVSVVMHRAAAGIDIRRGRYGSTTTFTADYYENADLLSTANNMPEDIAIGNYLLSHRGGVRLPFIDSLWWGLSGSIAGGWAASYNFDRDRFTFFKAEAVRLSTGSAEAGVKLPYSLAAGINGAAIKGKSPSGLLRLSALSAWSVFKPFDYRYTDAELAYREAGGFINWKWSRSCFELVPQLYCSHISARMTLSAAHREIVVLVPVYTDTTSITTFDNQLLLFEPSLNARVRLGSVVIVGSAYQELPWLIPDGKKVHDEPRKPLREREMIISGGTRLALSATWNLPGIKKQ